MGTESCDVLIVGAGPAGSVAARFLAGAGLDVLLADRCVFPRRKACGDGFTPRTTRDMIALGHARFLEESAQRISRYAFRFAPARPLVINLDLNRTYPPYAYTIRRSELDAELLRTAALSGAMVLEGHRLAGLERSGGRWHVGLEQAGGARLTVDAGFLIGADGAPSAVARSLGVEPSPGEDSGIAMTCYVSGVTGPDDTMEFIIDRELYPGAGWVFPLGGGIANVGIAVVYGARDRVQGNLGELLQRMLEGSPSTAARLRNAIIAGKPRAGVLPFQMFGSEPVGPGFLLAGDAAGLINPFCGEGVAFALESGWLAARAVAGAWPRLSVTRLWRYAQELRTLYAVPFKRGRALVHLTQNERFMGALSHVFTRNVYLNTRLFSLGYLKGASSWRKVFPGGKGAFEEISVRAAGD